MPATTCRNAVGEDIPVLMKMIAGLYADEGLDFEPGKLEPALRRLLAEPSLGRVLLLEGFREGERLAAGYAVVTLGFDLEFHGHDAYLTELWLEPWARGQGEGAILLREAEAAARKAGARALHLLAREENAPAMALYRRAGFVVSPRRFLTKNLD